MIALLLLAVATVALLTLFSGAGWLSGTLPGALPAGNLVAAIALCAPAGAALLLARRGTVLRRVTAGLLSASLAWLPLSLLLAGNPQFNFSGTRGTLWLVFTVSLAASTAGALVWALALDAGAAMAQGRGMSALRPSLSSRGG